MEARDHRPKHLNLLQIRLPVTGFVSIAHRLSGVMLFAFIPVSVYWLEASLASEASFTMLLESLSSPVMKLILTLLSWAFIHHLLAGIRFLLLDLHIGVGKVYSRQGAWAVLAAELFLVACFAIGIWI